MSLPPWSRTVSVVADGLRGLAVLTALWAIGEGVARWLSAVPLTGSLWGMIFLFVLLRSGLLPEAWVARASAALVRILGLLFVPVGVGIVAYGPLVIENAAALAVAIVVGSLATLAVAAATTAFIVRR